MATLVSSELVETRGLTQVTHKPLPIHRYILFGLQYLKLFYLPILKFGPFHREVQICGFSEKTRKAWQTLSCGNQLEWSRSAYNRVNKIRSWLQVA